MTLEASVHAFRLRVTSPGASPGQRQPGLPGVRDLPHPVLPVAAPVPGLRARWAVSQAPGASRDAPRGPADPLQWLAVLEVHSAQTAGLLRSAGCPVSGAKAFTPKRTPCGVLRASRSVWPGRGRRSRWSRSPPPGSGWRSRRGVLRCSCGGGAGTTARSPWSRSRCRCRRPRPRGGGLAPVSWRP